MGKVALFVLMSVLFLYTAHVSGTNSPWVPLADKLIYDTRHTFAKEYGLIFMGEGGAMYDCIHTMELAFQLQRPIGQNEGRVLMVELMKKFLDAVNEDESIRPYLDQYPATFKNIRITIFITGKDGSRLVYPDLGVISNVNDTISYKYDEEDIYRFYKEIKRESFEEAVEIIQQQQRDGTYQQFETRVAA